MKTKTKKILYLAGLFTGILFAVLIFSQIMPITDTYEVPLNTASDPNFIKIDGEGNPLNGIIVRSTLSNETIFRSIITVIFVLVQIFSFIYIITSKKPVLFSLIFLIMSWIFIKPLISLILLGVLLLYMSENKSMDIECKKGGV